jgi:hypothetical protein
MADQPSTAGRAPAPERERSIPLLAIVLAVSIAANLALAGVLVLGRAVPGSATAEGFNKDAWYGVFVNNNEAFVGHIASADSQNITMKDIWYLTVTAATDPATNKPYDNPKPDQIVTNIVPLGSSNLYGPKDTVQFSRQNMRYYAELKNDSPVVAKIVSCEQQGQNCPALKPAASPNR